MNSLPQLKVSIYGGSSDYTQTLKRTAWLLLVGGSETSVDETGSPTERHLLEPSGSFTVGQDLKHSASSSRRRKYTPESNTSSLGSDSPSSGRTTPTHKGPFNSMLRDDDDFESVNRSFGQSTNGQLLICQCPPDAELPGFDRRDFSWVFRLLMSCLWPKSSA